MNLELKIPVFLCVTAVFSSIFLSTGIIRCSASKFQKLDVALKGYDKRERPLEDISPVEVKVQIALSALGPINTKTFTFEADIFLRESWNDPRINIQNESTIALTGINPSLFLWVPDLHIINADHTQIQRMITESMCTWISPNGSVFLSTSIKGSFTCSMDLHLYPMDTQICSLELESYAFNDQDLNLVWEKLPVEYDQKSIKVSGFTVRKVYADVYNHSYTDLNMVSRRLKMSFHMDRTFSYYFYRTYVPSFFLVLLSWGTFHIPVTAYPARITLIMTNFLASTFILQHASSEYTKVAYTTAIEVYLLVNICFIMTTMLEYMIVLRIPPDIDILWSKVSSGEESIKKYNIEMEKSSHCNENMTEDEEVDPGSFVSDKRTQDKVKSSKDKNAKDVPTLHNIDRVSRLMIPIAYIIFNIVYFAYFLSKGKISL